MPGAEANVVLMSLFLRSTLALSVPTQSIFIFHSQFKTAAMQLTVYLAILSTATAVSAVSCSHAVSLDIAMFGAAELTNVLQGISGTCKDYHTCANQGNWWSTGDCPGRKC